MNGTRCVRCRSLTANGECLLCARAEEIGDLEIVKAHALINQLIDLYPVIRSTARGSDLLIDALGFDSNSKPDGAALRRMCRLLISAVASAAHLVKLASGCDCKGWSFEIAPSWSKGQVLAARLVVAGLNEDSSMAADLVVAAVADLDGLDAMLELTEALYWVIGAAADARQLAEQRQRATS